jgi:hypothetical protein
VDELVRMIAQRAGISSAQAGLAVSATVDYLTARLPSPLAGRIREQLDELSCPRPPDAGKKGNK